MIRLRTALFVLLFSLLALVVGTRMAGPLETDTSLGKVSMSLRPAWSGGVEVFVPVAEWGMRFHLFRAPAKLRIEPRSLNRGNALRLASGDREILAQARQDLVAGAVMVIARNLVWVLLASALFGLLAAHLAGLSPPRMVGATCVTSVAIFALAGGLAWLTYSGNSVREPVLYARGAELEQLISAFSRESSKASGSYGGNFERVLRGVGSFLSAQPAAPGRKEAVLASDFHANVLLSDALRNFAGRSDVFMPGDFAITGSSAEADLVADDLAGLGSRVFASSGNHDSALLMKEMARSGAIVLGQRGRLLPNGGWSGRPVFNAGDFTIAGYRDPREWRGEDPENPDRIFSFDDMPGGEERQAEAEREMWRWWQKLPEKPDILMVHQASLARGLAERIGASGAKLLLLTGHDHRQWIARYGGVTVVDAGSAGAGGLLGAGTENAEIARLHFGVGGLESAELIAIDPVSGSSSAERVIIDDLCPAESSCLLEARNQDRPVRIG